MKITNTEEYISLISREPLPEMIEIWNNISLENIVKEINGIIYVEEWLKVTIEPFCEYYFISNFGRIKKAEKIVIGKCGSNRRLKIRILSQSVVTKGYLYFRLAHQSSKFNSSIARLVALAFIPNPENKPQVNHKDANKKNNYVSNLEWATNGENGKHAWDNGLKTKREGGNHAQSKLTDNQAKDIIIRYNKGEKAYRIWKSEYKNIVSYDCIKRVARRRTFKNLQL